MGKLSPEIEGQAESLYASKEGFLIIITEAGEVDIVKRKICEYCDNECRICLADVLTIPLGEIDPALGDSKLFAVGLVDLKSKDICPLANCFWLETNLLKQEK